MKQQTTKFQFLKKGLIALFLFLSISSALNAQRKVVLILGASNAAGTGMDQDIFIPDNSMPYKYNAVNCETQNIPTPSSIPSFTNDQLTIMQNNNIASGVFVGSDTDGSSINWTMGYNWSQGNVGFSTPLPAEFYTQHQNRKRHGLEAGLAKRMCSYPVFNSTNATYRNHINNNRPPNQMSGNNFGIIKLALSGTDLPDWENRRIEIEQRILQKINLFPDQIEIIGIIWMVGGAYDINRPDYAYANALINYLASVRRFLQTTSNSNWKLKKSKKIINGGLFDTSYNNTPIIIQKIPLSSIYNHSVPTYTNEYRDKIIKIRQQHELVSSWMNNVFTMELSGLPYGGVAYLRNANNDKNIHASSYTITNFGGACAFVFNRYYSNFNEIIPDSYIWSTNIARPSNPSIDEITSNSDSQKNTQNIESIGVFPNPVTNTLNIQDNFSENSEIKIVDLQGRVVKEIKPNALSEIQTLTIDVSEMNAGIYIVNKYVDGELTKSTKIIKE